MEKLSLDKCKHRVLYKINSRNLDFGVFNKNTKSFIGIREKLRSYFLFAEYHYDIGAPFGTVHPKEELEHIPKDISLEERLGTIDEKTGRPVNFDKSIMDGGKGWYFTDTNESSEKIYPVSISNNKLFDWLKKKEKQYALKS